MRIVDTAKDWKDNLQSRLPGNAERIVQIKLTSKEGGYNLAMDEPTLERMNAIGALAGETLVEAFANDNFKRFDEHRYLRALSFLKEFSERIVRVDEALKKPSGGATVEDAVIEAENEFALDLRNEFLFLLVPDGGGVRSSARAPGSVREEESGLRR